MNIYISHMTAVWFWRTVYHNDRSPAGALWSAELLDPCVTAEDIWSYMPSWATSSFTALVDGRIDVLVPDKNMCWKSSTRVSHMWSGKLPPGSLFSARDDVFVSSPEFVFLQLASQCTLAELVAYGCELCGTYAFDPSSLRGFKKRLKPLTTKAKLIQYLEGAAGSKGVEKGLRAAHLVIENCASPMETAVALLLCLPYRYGGYGLIAPEMNFRIDLPLELQKRVGKSHLKADFYWQGCHVILEYQGEFDHSGRAAINADSNRLSVLRELGFSVEFLTWGQVVDLAGFELVVMRLSRSVGKRISTKYRGMTRARGELRDELFAWNAANGIPGFCR